MQKIMSKTIVMLLVFSTSIAFSSDTIRTYIITNVRENFEKGMKRIATNKQDRQQYCTGVNIQRLGFNNPSELAAFIDQRRANYLKNRQNTTSESYRSSGFSVMLDLNYCETTEFYNELLEIQKII